MKILIVEPHADDAFLSLHGHMTSWVKQGIVVDILTIYSSPKRDREGGEYAKKIGAVYRSLTIQDQSHLGTAPRPIPEIASWEIDLSGETQLVFPLGLQHPDHLQVASLAPVGAWRYLEVPYYTKQKNQQRLAEEAQGMVLKSIGCPRKTKWVNCKIFKSQSKFFYFNPPESLHPTPEIVLFSRCRRIKKAPNFRG